jgi:DeoR family transcriptional regulator of aga operon
MNDANVSKGSRRREQLMTLLKQQGKITVQEIVERFECSEATARRDLEVMERTEPLIRTIGGAMYDGMNTSRDLPFAEKTGLSFLEKERIARKAASLIREGDIIELKSRRGITVVTNAVNIAMELAGSEIGVLVTGGMMRHNSFELCGPLGEAMIGHLNIGKMFIGVDGISTDSGITTYSEQEAQIAKALISRSQSVYAVFDHTKVGTTSLFAIAPLSGLHGLITDEPLTGAIGEAAAKHGLSVYTAELTQPL